MSREHRTVRCRVEHRVGNGEVAMVREDAAKDESPDDGAYRCSCPAKARAEKSRVHRKVQALNEPHWIWRIVGQPSTTSTRSAVDAFAASHEVGHNTTRVGVSSSAVSSES
jgi:hypothetical protein